MKLSTIPPNKLRFTFFWGMLLGGLGGICGICFGRCLGGYLGGVLEVFWEVFRGSTRLFKIDLSSLFNDYSVLLLLLCSEF